MLNNKIAIVLSLALVAAAGTQTATAAQPEPASDEGEQKVSHTKVELELTAGKQTLKFDPQTLQLGEQGTFIIEQDDHHHELRARVLDANDSDSAQAVVVVLDYKRDSEKIFMGAQLRLDLGGAAVKPAGDSKVKVRVSRTEPKPSNHKIDIPEGNDPLSGL